MPADASIFSLIRPAAPQEGPVDQYAKILGLRNMQDESALRALQRTALTNQLQEEDAFRAAAQESGGDMMKLRDLLYKRGAAKSAMSVEDRRLKAEKDAAELARTKTQTEKDRQAMEIQVADRLTNLYGSVLNAPPEQKQNAYLAALQQAKTIFGPDHNLIKNAPQQYPGDDWAKQQLDATLTYKDRLEAQDRAAGRTEQARHNQETERQARAAMAQAERHFRETKAIPNLQHVELADGMYTFNAKTGQYQKSVGPDGQPLQGGRPLTESQGKAGGMAMRAREAQAILNQLEDQGETNRGIIKQGVEKVPLIGEGVAMGVNMLPGALGGPNENQQKVEQARRNFVNAVLRVESGASINESEFRNAEKQYFPMPGDSPAVIAQKRANRETAIKALEMQAGPAAKAPKSTTSNGSAPPGGTASGGIKFLGFD